MRCLIFFTFFAHFSSVICKITISVTGTVFSNQPHAVAWTREPGDLEILRVFKLRPGQRSESQVPTLVVDTNGALSGTSTVLFEAAAKIRQIGIKDTNDIIVALSDQFSVVDSVSTSAPLSQPSTKPSSRPSDSGGQDKEGFGNPAILGSVVAAGGVVVIILSLLVFFSWRLRRRRRKHYALMEISSPKATYAYVENPTRFSDRRDMRSPKIAASPARPPRATSLQLDDDLYHISTPTSALQAERNPQISINTAAGRVHSHQASLTLISPYDYEPSPLIGQSPNRRFLGQMDSPKLHSPLRPSPGLVSPFNYNDPSPLTSTSPDRRFLGPLDSPVSPSPASFNSASPILAQPPERFASRDSKRYLAYRDAQRSRAEAQLERGPRDQGTTTWNRDERDEGWRSSWRDSVADPPPSYSGHANRI